MSFGESSRVSEDSNLYLVNVFMPTFKHIVVLAPESFVDLRHTFGIISSEGTKHYKEGREGGGVFKYKPLP